MKQSLNTARHGASGNPSGTDANNAKPGVRRRVQRGFTLLEVLVATLIMGIAVAGTLSGISAATRNASRLTQYDRATLLARQKMDELLVESGQGGSAGAFDPAQTGGVDIRWSAQVSAFEGGVGPNIVERVALEISWMDGATQRVFALEGFRRGRLRPGQTAPPARAGF